MFLMYSASPLLSKTVVLRFHLKADFILTFSQIKDLSKFLVSYIGFAKLIS